MVGGWNQTVKVELYDSSCMPWQTQTRQPVLLWPRTAASACEAGTEVVSVCECVFVRPKWNAEQAKASFW